MNLITFAAGIGVPIDFKISYDDKTKSLKGGLDEGVCPSCCRVVSADLKLKVFFSVEGGELCGFEYECGPLELLPEVEITLPHSPDGFVKIDKHYSVMSPESNFVAFTEVYAVCDKQKHFILVGCQKQDACMFKVSQNMCIGLDPVGAIGCFLIEI